MYVRPFSCCRHHHRTALADSMAVKSAAVIIRRNGSRERNCRAMSVDVVIKSSLQLAESITGALLNGRIQLRSLLHTRCRVFRRGLSKPAARLKLIHVIIPQPGKTNSCSSSSPRFGKQIGQVIKAVTMWDAPTAVTVFVDHSSEQSLRNTSSPSY